VAEAELDVSEGAFQNEFVKLTEPRSSPNDIAVFAPQREKCGFGVRTVMVDPIILQEVVSDAVPVESAVLEYRFNAF